MGRGFGVSAAVGDDVIGQLAGEAERLGYTSYYESVSHFHEHLARMGATARDTCVVAAGAAGLHAGIEPFEAVLDETIVRAITPTDSFADIATLLRACAPRRA